MRARPCVQACPALRPGLSHVGLRRRLEKHSNLPCACAMRRSRPTGQADWAPTAAGGAQGAAARACRSRDGVHSGRSRRGLEGKHRSPCCQQLPAPARARCMRGGRSFLVTCHRCRRLGAAARTGRTCRSARPTQPVCTCRSVIKMRGYSRSTPRVPPQHRLVLD